MVVEELVAKIGLEFEGANKAIEAAHHISSIGAALTGVGSILLASKAAFEGLALSVAEEVEHLQDFGDAIGISVGAIQTLAAAAAPAGASVEDVETGLRKLADAAGSAAKGNEAMIKTFEDIGVKVTNASGHVKPMQQLLEEVGTGLAKIKDPALAVNASIDLLGRGAVKLLPAMKSLGTNGFEALRAEGERLGVVMGEETVKQFAKAGESFNGLELRAKGFKNIIAKAFLPSLQKSLDTLTKFYDANADKIEEIAKRVASAITKPFALLSDVLGGIIKGVMDFISVLSPVEKGILGVMGLVGGLAIAFTLPAVPILILAALIAAIAEDLQNFRKGLPSVIGDIVKEFDNFKFQLEDVAKNGHGVAKVIATIADAIVSLTQAIAGLLSGGGMAAVQAALEPKALRNEDVSRAMQIRGMLSAGKASRRQQDVVDDVVNDPFAAFSQSKYDAAGALQGMSTIGQAGIPSAYQQAAPTVHQGDVNVTVNATPGMDENELASKVASEVKNQMDFTAEEVASAFGRQK